MRSAFKSDHAPDIAEVEYQQIPAFLLNNMLLKLNDYIDAEDEQKFIPAILEQATYQKGIYGVPHDAGAMALFYREDLFDKWNIDVPATWDQFADAAEKVRKKRPKARMCAFPPGSSSVFKALAWQAGAQWVTQHGDSWRVAVDDHPSLKVAKFWQNLLDEDLVKPEQVLTNGFFKDLLDDNLACFPAASWCSEGMRDKLHNKQKGKWRVAKLPQWNRGEYLSGNWGGSTLAIMKSSDHPKAAAKAALWMCINKKSLTAPIAKNDQFQLPTIKHHPQVTDAFNDTSFSEFFGGQDVLTVFEDAAAHVNKKWSESPVDAQTRDALNKYFADAINKGHGTLVAALKKAQSAAESAMKKAGLQVA
jgi:multiple sugar transport system substrate-binding protein